MSNSNLMNTAACGAAGLALVLSVASLMAQPVVVAEAPPQVDVDRMERIEESIEALRRQVARSNDTTRDRVRSGASNAATSELVAPELMQRLDAMEVRIAVAEEFTSNASSAHDAEHAGTLSVAQLVAAARGPTPEGGTEDWQRVAVDRSADASKRVAALRALRGVTDGRTRDVALAMRDLFRESDDTRLRTDIIRQLSRVVEPELEAWFIETLQNDTHTKTREEAAENLAHFANSATARDALEQAAENDKDRGVRSECRDSLDKLGEDVR